MGRRGSNERVYRRMGCKGGGGVDRGWEVRALRGK